MLSPLRAPGGAPEPLWTPHRDHRQCHLPLALSAAVQVSDLGPLPWAPCPWWLESSPDHVVGFPSGPSWNQAHSGKGCGVCWIVWKDSVSRVPFTMCLVGPSCSQVAIQGHVLLCAMAADYIAASPSLQRHFVEPGAACRRPEKASLRT
jgi:hypothetical protein